MAILDNKEPLPSKAESTLGNQSLQPEGPTTVSLVPLEQVVVGPRHRTSRPDDVARLTESLKESGLRSPIAVRRSPDGTLSLVAGYDRLLAAKSLGWSTIPAFIETGTEHDAELWEIQENLCRSELTHLERGEHIARLAQLRESQNTRHGDAKSSAPGRPLGGNRALARELSISEATVRRDRKIGSLSEKAKAAARELGFSDNAKVLRTAAEKTSPDQQAAAIRSAAAPVARQNALEKGHVSSSVSRALGETHDGTALTAVNASDGDNAPTAEDIQFCVNMLDELLKIAGKFHSKDRTEFFRLCAEQITNIKCSDSKLSVSADPLRVSISYVDGPPPAPRPAPPP